MLWPKRGALSASAEPKPPLAERRRVQLNQISIPITSADRIEPIANVEPRWTALRLSVAMLGGCALFMAGVYLQSVATARAEYVDRTIVLDTFGEPFQTL
jgi:hypothetical protein